MQRRWSKFRQSTKWKYSSLSSGQILGGGWLWCAAVILAGSCQGTSAQNKTAAPTYVGSETCAGCHEEHPKMLKGSVHSQTMAIEEKKPAKGNGCESCHGPGSLHAADPSKENILTFKTESTVRRSNACLACHGKKTGMMDFKRAFHRINMIACDQCHTTGDSKAFHSMRRGADLKRVSSAAALCAGCHTEVKADFSMPFRHRVNEGIVACQDCHREHGGFLNGRRGAAQFSEACVRCHPDKSGPFTFEHVPMRIGGCSSCHAPHGSANPRLLTRSEVRTLCLECHTNTPAGHNLSQTRYQNCTLCHRDIHGSNHDKRFL